MSCFAETKATSTAEDKVPFSYPVGRDFMSVARHDFFVNEGPASLAEFPKDLSSLAKLARGIQKSKRMQRAIDKGWIYPTMGRDQVAHAIHMAKPASERDKWIPPERIWQRRVAAAQRSILKLDHAHQMEIYRWLRETLADDGSAGD
jgi:hypothetical protein